MEGMENIINQDLITLELKANSKEEAILELTPLLFRAGKLRSLTGFIAAVNQREKTMSTYCGSHVAIPHAESIFVSQASFAFGRSKGFLWGEEDGNVNFVFLLAIPEIGSDSSSESDHIELMSSIAKLALEEEVRNKWAAAKTKEDILETFRSV